MIKKLIAPLVLAFFLTNCNNNAPTQTVVTTTSDAPAEIIPTDIPQWQLTTTEDSMAIPHTKIQLIYKQPITLKEGVGNFRIFDKPANS